MKVPFSYLPRQFSAEQLEPYLEDFRRFVPSGMFTLGQPLQEFERRFSELCGTRYALGVANGTDAIFLSLKSLNIGSGDEVITTPMTFIATIGAIVQTGATPVLVDSEDGFVIDLLQIQKAITSKTKAILPVHYTGNLADIGAIKNLAWKYNLAVVEDACQAVDASISIGGKQRMAGAHGDLGCFSLHPLKNLNIWGGRWSNNYERWNALQ